MKLKILTTQTLVNENGESILSTTYKKIISLPRNYYALKTQDDLWFIAGPNGNILSDITIKTDKKNDFPDSNELLFNSSGHICVLINNKWHFIGSDNEISKMGFDDVKPNLGNPHLIAVSINNLWGFVDIYGNIKVPVSFEKPDYFTRNSNLPLFLKKEDYYYFFEPKIGFTLYLDRLDYVSPFKYEPNLKTFISRVKLNGKENILMADNCTLLLDTFAEKIQIMSFGIISTINNLLGLYDFNGKQIFSPIYQSISYLKSSDSFYLKRNGKYGIANSFGIFLTPFNYDGKIKITHNFAILKKDEYMVLYKFFSGEIFSAPFISTSLNDSSDFVLEALNQYLS